MIFILLILLLSVFLPTPVVALPLPQERKIIVFRQEVSTPIQEEIFTKLKITPFKSLKLINAKAAFLSSAEISFLQKDPRVLRIDPDVEVYALPDGGRALGICDYFPTWPGCTPAVKPTPSPTPTPIFQPTPTPTPEAGSSFQTIPWGITKINADDAWLVSSGSGVKVAVVDTGIDTDHPDLNDNLAGCFNFIQSWKNCEDDNGHGTHVSGIIAAENNNLGVIGVAPESKIYALKVLNRRGSGYLSDIIEALDWSVVNKMQVVNMSLGTSSDVQSFHDAVKKVYQNGITQVAAAGNSGPGANTVLYPARYPEVIAVSATDINNQVPSWSSRGPEVDLAAPGVDVYSTYLKAGYKTLSGTSMSAPHVVGVVALRLEDHSSEGPSTIEAVLEANTDSLPFDPTDPTWVGAGLVNAYKVVTAP